MQSIRDQKPAASTVFRSNHESSETAGAPCSAQSGADTHDDIAVNKAGVVVCIPAYNEEVAIGSVIIRSKKYADTIVVVNDCSVDKTAEIARLAGAEVVSHNRNKGYGAAIRTCFNMAKAVNAEKMVILDGDGQHNPDDILPLLKEMEKTGADIVIGSRFIGNNGSSQKIPAYRKVGMKALDMVTMMGCGLSLTDSQSGFRAYSKKAISEIKLDIEGMGAGSEILMNAAEKKLRIREVPIYVRYDIKGTSSEHPIVHGFSVLGSVIGITAQKRPLAFLAMPGLILLIAGTVLYSFMIQTFNVTRDIPLGYAIMGVLCLIFGAIGLFTALSLISVDRISKKYARSS